MSAKMNKPAKTNNGRPVCFEAIEARRMLSAADVPTGGLPFDMSDPEQVKRMHETVITTSDGVALAAFGGRRTGIFELPTVRADGSVDITGTSENDVISAERTTGVHETSDKDGGEADGELNFVSLIGADGKRVISPYADSYPTGSNIKNIQNLISDIENNVNQPNPLPVDANGEIVYEYNLPRLKKELAALQAQTAAFTSGDFTKYTLAGVYDYYVQNDPATASKATIRVDGGAGNDAISVSSNVMMRTKLSGGSGADKLVSGKKHADLFGGGGNDMLVSRSLKGGTLDGGKGSDRYYNRSTAFGAAGEIKVLARNDGDRVIVGSTNVPVVSTGMFGKSAINRDDYFLVDGSDGQVDLLA